MSSRDLQKSALGHNEDWYGNNAAVRCPVCRKVFIVSSFLNNGHRDCPVCHESIMEMADGRVTIRWPDEQNSPEPRTGAEPGKDESHNEQEYRKFFLGTKGENALEKALDIRKFEINLYWHRAAYFWALIAAAFAGYFAILSAQKLEDKEYLAYIVGCIGLLFTWAWFLVNKGSKYWQENWENHVDMLENEVTGPLYKTVLHRAPPANLFECILGPAPISVSKVNQWASSFTLCVWSALVLHVLPFKLSLSPSAKHAVVAGITLVFGFLMWVRGKTHESHPPRLMKRREAHIR